MMKVLVWTRDILLQQFLHAILKDVEGASLVFAQQLDDQAPDQKGGWVVAVASEDAHAGDLHPVLAHPWVAGAVRFRTGPSVGIRSSVEGPYGDEIGIVELALPATPTAIIQSLSGAAVTQSQASEFEERTASATVLVAEDSPLQRQLVVGALKAEGFHVLDAEDGAAAWTVLEQVAVDLLITDVEMPNLTGLQLARKVRTESRTPQLPILMLTTLSGFEEIKAGFDAGASDYLVKPLKGERELFMDELVQRVFDLLGETGPEAGRAALVVDDSKLTRTMVAGTLQRSGFLVTTAEDGAQAKALLEDPGVPLPEIVVTDLEMPVMDGLRLTHFIKRNPRTRELPVVILSASTEHEHRVLGRGFGVDAFLSKPFSEEKLQVTVEQVLTRNRLEKEKRELSKIMGRDVLRAIHHGGLEARSREVTILFSDLAGFSKMCFGMSAGDVVQLLNEYFDRFVDFVLREQGYINKFIGDALVALFSALPGLDPPAVRASRAALAFQREIAVVNRTAQQPLRTRIGINTGEVIMGLIGGGERKDYTVIGDNVNRAQRLESKSPVDGLLLSERSYAEAKDYLARQSDARVERIDGLDLKGIAEPVTAYAVTLKES
jgi:CheY-like chemotaxis protein/class 3 adenylate cyclase